MQSMYVEVQADEDIV